LLFAVVFLLLIWPSGITCFNIVIIVIIIISSGPCAAPVPEVSYPNYFMPAISYPAFFGVGLGTSG